jgi:hypothetical protein
VHVNDVYIMWPCFLAVPPACSRSVDMLGFDWLRDVLKEVDFSATATCVDLASPNSL